MFRGRIATNTRNDDRQLSEKNFGGETEEAGGFGQLVELEDNGVGPAVEEDLEALVQLDGGD